MLISIHAPTRGATVRHRRQHPRRGSDFNPRAHEGRDKDPSQIWDTADIISIHAPTRGATPLKRCHCDAAIFQSTRPRGARRSKDADGLSSKLFQSTRPRGARPRSRARISPGRRISIHAPTRGATACSALRAISGTISIHAPTRGATLSDRRLTPVPTVFQSTRPRGARRLRNILKQNIMLFQSTRPRGARPDIYAFIYIPVDISIHAPTRGATKRPAISWQRNRNFNPRAHEGRDV